MCQIMEEIREKGFQKGRLEGIQKGRQEGIQKGIQITIKLYRQLGLSRGVKSDLLNRFYGRD